MAARDSVVHLQVDTHQGTSSQDAGSHKHAWLFRALCLAGLMLIGVAAWKCLPLPSSHAQSSPGHLPALAFNLGVPGIRTGGLRPVQKGLVQTGSSKPVTGPLHLSMEEEWPLSRRDVLLAAVGGLAMEGYFAVGGPEIAEQIATGKYGMKDGPDEQAKRAGLSQDNERTEDVTSGRSQNVLQAMIERFSGRFGDKQNDILEDQQIVQEGNLKNMKSQQRATEIFDELNENNILGH